MTFYWCSIWLYLVSFLRYRYSMSKNIATFKIPVKGHWMWYNSIDWVWLFCVNVLFDLWTFRPTDISHGRFAQWAFRPMDISPHGHSGLQKFWGSVDVVWNFWIYQHWHLLCGPTKVKPTYIFVSKIWIKFEWIDKIQWFLVNAITVHSHTLGSIKI